MFQALKFLLLVLFLASTPIALYAVYFLEMDRIYCAIANSYAFSIAMIGLYVYPFVISDAKYNNSMTQRIHNATMNWIIWLSVFTEIVFQIPHNLCVKQLHAIQGSAIEWPFYSYGLCDSRWNNYHDGTHLNFEVELINYNDAILGIFVLLSYLYYKNSNMNYQSTIIFVLTVIFRDATLFRETVEYMWDHHHKDYIYTTTDEVYRIHGIVCLWLVNGIWLIAPIVSLFWGYNMIMPFMTHHAVKTKKER